MFECEQLFHRGLSEEFDWKAGGAAVARQVLHASAAPIAAFLHAAWQRLGETPHGQQPHLLAWACERLAKERLAVPTPICRGQTPLASPHQINPAKSRYCLAPLPKELQLPLEERFALCRGFAAECIDDRELRELLQKCPNPVAYDGFGNQRPLFITNDLYSSCPRK